jgi:hypothetical protein
MTTGDGDGGDGTVGGDRYRRSSMSRRETERSGAGPAGRWWGRAVVACASLAALAGTVAAVATAAGADGDQAERADAAEDAAARAAANASRTPTPRPAADTAAAVTTKPAAPRTGPERVGAAPLGATVEIPPDWQEARDQDLVPVAPDRFPTVVTLADRATVLVGRMDAARGFGPDVLADEARRLVGAFADGATRQAPGGGGRIADVSDDAGRLDGRDSHTAVRRVSGAKGPGALVRVTTVAGVRGEPGLVLLAVAAPGPRQAADAGAADRIVRSLSSAPPDAPPSSRAQAPPASSAPGLPPRGAAASPAAPPGPPRPTSSRAPVSPPRPVPPTDR